MESQEKQQSMKRERLKETLLGEVEHLPTTALLKALQYVQYLKRVPGEERMGEPESEADPLLQLVGIADVPPFAHVGMGFQRVP